jgi:hypothetical protein
MRHSLNVKNFKATVGIIFVLIYVSLLRSSYADAAPDAGEAKAQVSILGVFHFSNPGLDVVKTKKANVLEPDNQAYLASFSERIALGLKPTKVLVECNRKNQASIDDKFSRYLRGTYQLNVNEVEQLGFRVAKASSAEVICFDEREVHWQAGDLFSYMKEHDAKAQARFDSLIKDMTNVSNHMHAELSLKDILKKLNSKNLDRANKWSYIATNDVGAETNFYGADATASWWHRNFRMYANIQKAASAGERVLVIAGQGHTAILRDILDDDLLRQTHTLEPYF